MAKKDKKVNKVRQVGKKDQNKVKKLVKKFNKIVQLAQKRLTNIF